MSGRIIANGPASVHNPDWQLDRIVGELRAARADWHACNSRTEVTGCELPLRGAVRQILEALRGALFPIRFDPADPREESEGFHVGRTLDSAFNALIVQARLELRYMVRQMHAVDRNPDARAMRLVYDLAAASPMLRRLLDTNVLATYHGDPAVRSIDEVLLHYPGILVVIHHRIARHLYHANLPLLMRMITETTHADTDIDIHPGTQIGSGFFIDHGTDVVIGEITVTDERVQIYQAVTFGAKRFSTDADGHLEKDVARHPMVEGDIIIYVGVVIFERITIGRGSSTGDSMWLTRSVSPGSSITQTNMQSGVQEGVQGPRSHTHSHSEAHPVR